MSDTPQIPLTPEQREDVEQLRSLAIPDALWWQQDFVQSLAARIAALLPPAP